MGDDAAPARARARVEESRHVQDSGQSRHVQDNEPGSDREGDRSERSTVLALHDARRLEECMAAGGVAVFPADTVYGLCCDPENRPAVNRLYELKGRPSERPAAVMFFSLMAALRVLVPLPEHERAAIAALLPGPITLLLANPHGRFPLACGPDPSTLGLRVPSLPEPLAALSAIERPVMQSSANISGGPEARRLEDVPVELRDGADLTLDGGELPGVASTVLDLREYPRTGEWTILRAGAMERATIERALLS